MKDLFLTEQEWNKLKKKLIDGFGKESWAQKFGYAWEGNYFKVGKKRYSYLLRPDLGGVIIIADKKLLQLLQENNIKFEEW